MHWEWGDHFDALLNFENSRLEANNRTITKPGFFVKAPRDLPLSHGWSRVSLNFVTNPVRDYHSRREKVAIYM